MKNSIHTFQTVERIPAPSGIPCAAILLNSRIFTTFFDSYNHKISSFLKTNSLTKKIKKIKIKNQTQTQTSAKSWAWREISSAEGAADAPLASSSSDLESSAVSRLRGGSLSAAAEGGGTGTGGSTLGGEEAEEDDDVAVVVDLEA